MLFENTNIRLVIDGYMSWGFWKLFQEAGEISDIIQNKDKTKKVIIYKGGGEFIPQRIDLILKENDELIGQAYMAKAIQQTLHLTPIEDPVDIKAFKTNGYIYKPIGLVGAIFHGFYEWDEKLLNHVFTFYSGTSNSCLEVERVKTYIVTEPEESKCGVSYLSFQHRNTYKLKRN